MSLTWTEATNNIGRKVRFVPAYSPNNVYEGRIVGVDCPRGNPRIPEVYLVTRQGEDAPSTMWENTNRVPVADVEFLDDGPILREEAYFLPPGSGLQSTKMSIDTGIGQQDVDLASPIGTFPSLLNFAQLQKEVGEWSQANFDYNIVRATMFMKDVPPSVIEVNWLCALMGIAEEIGEFFMSTKEGDMGQLIEHESTLTEKRDSLGDIVIYCCDYAYRHEIPLLVQYDPKRIILHPPLGLMGSLGALMHCNLKRLQGIRGFDDEGKFRNHNVRWLHSVMRYASATSQWLLQEDLLVIANETWSNIVKKRDWKKSAKDGVTTE